MADTLLAQIEAAQAAAETDKLYGVRPAFTTAEIIVLLKIARAAQELLLDAPAPGQKNLSGALNALGVLLPSAPQTKTSENEL